MAPRVRVPGPMASRAPGPWPQVPRFVDPFFASGLWPLGTGPWSLPPRRLFPTSTVDTLLPPLDLHRTAGEALLH